MSRRIITVSFVLGVLAGLSGCALHRVDSQEAVVPPVEMTSRYYEALDEVAVGAGWDGGSWWESFGDPALNRLMVEGLQGNFSLQEVAARIAQARALARQSRATLFPSLAASAGYEFEWDDEVAANADGDREESSQAGALLSWEVDLLGRLSSERKARAFQAEASLQDWLDARLLLSAAVADRYFAIKEQRRQLEVIAAQIAINESLLKLTTQRFGQGQASIVDVLQQREQLDETRARVPQAEALLGELQYGLDALLGNVPGTGNEILDSSIAALPSMPDVGIPAALLQRRPDLRAARLRIVALDYRVGEAVAAQFPRLRLGGAVDWQGDPDFGDAVRSAFADLAVPLFAGGGRKAEVTLRRADLEEALASYSNEFLGALAEVESALLLERKLAERLLLVEDQLATARKLLAEARNRYSQGLTDYLPVFTSLTILQNLERDIVSARRGVLSARVRLHRALGGPIDPSDPDTFFSSKNE